MTPDTWQVIRVVAPWMLFGLLVLGVLLVANQPLFRIIDEMIYGSVDTADEMVRANEEWAQRREANIFNQAESWINDGHAYHAPRHLTTGQFVKCALVIAELLGILWFISLFRH